jgi:hypothetical protein
MAYVKARTLNTGDLISASDANQWWGDNAEYLLSGRPASTIRYSSAYSTTSTSFVDIDATNLIRTITVTGGRVLCFALFNRLLVSTTPTGYYSCIDFIVDSTTRLGDTTWGSLIVSQAVDEVQFMYGIAGGLSAGSHTFKLQWKAANTTPVTTVTTTAPLNGIPLITFTAMEL